MVARFLLDENISPAAAIALAADGFDAWHVRDRGLEGSTDDELLERAYQEDRILVTFNVGDLEKLVGERELHAGVVLIERAGLLRDEQIALIKRVATVLVAQRDLVNRVIRVNEDDSIAVEGAENEI